MTAAPPRTVSVGVLVTLHRGPGEGGHVRCWERFAEAAVDTPELDLTVYFLGDNGSEHRLGPRTRYVTLRPRLGTDRFAFLRQGAGDTDLAPVHGRLAALLPRHDVLHATDTFAFGRTARRVARRSGRPLVFSFHTHLPRFTRVYARRIFRRTFGMGVPGWLGLDHVLVDALRVHVWAARLTRRSVEGFMRDSRTVFVSNEQDRAWATDTVPPARVRMLRRGIDPERFRPRANAAVEVRRRYALPDRPLVLFAGRVDDSKNVLLVARALRRLLDSDATAHLVVVGEGERTTDLAHILGPAVSCLGALPQEALADVYAAADVFAFPSRTETVGNVVIEALSSGLPAVVAAGTSCAERVAGAGRVGPVDAGTVVAEDSPEAWAEALRPFLSGNGRKAAASAAARRRIERGWPSWSDVLREDLLPVWTELRQPRP